MMMMMMEMNIYNMYKNLDDAEDFGAVRYDVGNDTLLQKRRRQMKTHYFC